MTKRWIGLAVILIVAATGAVALDEAAIERADALYEDDQPQAAFDILEGALGTARNDRERAEVLWRMSRAKLDIAEQLEDRGEGDDIVLRTYEEGEQFGIQAVQADPNNHLGYYWQSSNIGKWGQRKGILNSLFKAGPMRDLLKQAISVEPKHADSYYVLGQLYEKVPGWPVSFGNGNYSVSLGRLSIDLHDEELASGERDELNHDFYVQLASHLIQRNWDRGKRASEQTKKRRDYDRTNDVLERGWHYEGMVQIPNQSDREEAEDILRRMVRSLEQIADRSDGQNRQLTEARELLEQL